MTKSEDEARKSLRREGCTIEPQYTGINRFLRSAALQEIANRSGGGVFRELYRDWKWMFAFAWKRKGFVVLYTLLGLAASSVSLLISYLAKMLINAVAANAFQGFALAAVVYAVGIAVSIALSAITSRMSARITVCISNDIREQIFARIIDAKWADIAAFPTGDLLNRMSSDVSTIAANAVNWIPGIIVSVYTFVLTFVILWRLDLVMALISVVAAPVLLIVSRCYMRKLQEQRRKVSALSSELMSFESDTFANYDMIKSFGVNDYCSRQLASRHGKYTDCSLEYNRIEVRSRVMMSVTSALTAAVSFAYCLYRLSVGKLLYGDMTFFLSQRGIVSDRFNSIVGAFPGLLNSAVAAQRVRELFELPGEEHNENALQELTDSSGITVRLENVAFSYNESTQVYRGADFIARPGEIVTILGSSGEGKTTLLRMILGLVSPDSGAVSLIGTNGKEAPVNADLRKLISYVPQGNTTVSGTVAENLRMVREDASDAELIEALQTACAWEFVQRMPEGIHTALGGSGHGVSMGQAQRISIARALLRDSPVLILDEATSALDTETEAKVLKNIVSVCPEKTCIVSTHRPSILKLSDRVYRIEDKKLVELDRTKYAEGEQNHETEIHV